MASFRKRGANWSVTVCVNGVRRYGTFPTKTQARLWAAQLETDAVNTKYQIVSPTQSVGDLLTKYAAEISIKKRGHRAEHFRIKKLLTYPLAKIGLIDLTPIDIATWRDQRLHDVS